MQMQKKDTRRPNTNTNTNTKNARPLAEPRGLTRRLAEPRLLGAAAAPRFLFPAFPRTNRSPFEKGAQVERRNRRTI